MTTQCPKCNAENPDTKSFCGDCGTQLGPSKDIPTQTKTLVTPPQELRRGTTIADRYEVIERLGTGGMGTVYRIEDKKIHEDVALKLIKPEIAANKKIIERFNNELKVARKIAHRNVCKMYDIGESEGAHFITMEYVPGEDLKSLIRRVKQIPIGTAISITKQVCDGLTEAHRLGVIHRDLKPSNIMIDKDGNARIMDFGIARSLKGKSITGAGVIIGTPEYMSPEQVEGKDIDHRSDIYSLGVILYEMVTGQVPFDGDTPLSIAHKHKYEAPQEPNKVNAQIPEDLNLVILKSLEKDKEKRYQSSGELHSELENIEKGIPTTEKEIPKRKPLTSKEVTVTFGWKKLFIPVLVILVLAAIAFLIFRKTGPDLDPNRIVVAIFDNQTGDPTHDTIGHMAADWITQGLAQTGLVDIVPSMSVEKIYRGHEGENPIRLLTQETKAGTVISGTYYLQGDTIQFHAQVIDARKGKLLKVLEPVSGPTEDPTKPIESLRQQVMTTIAHFFEPEIKDWAEVLYMPPSYEAYKEFLEGWVLFWKTEYKQALDHLLRSAALDPEYASPRLWGFWAYMNLSEYAKADALNKEVDKLSERLTPYDRHFFELNKADLRGDNLGAYRAMVQIAQLAPVSLEQYDVGEFAVKINRPQEAVDLITPVDPEGPLLKGWWPYWDFLTRAYHILGDHKQELKEARRGRKQYPNFLTTLFFELRALAALGKINEINKYLNKGLTLPPQFPISYGFVLLATGRELRAHGYREESLQVLARAIKWYENRPKEEADTKRHRGRLAEVFYTAERWEEARVLFENLHSEYMDDIDYLGYLGALAARQGDRKEALKIAGLLENDERPYLFGRHIGWSASIAALLGKKERAVRLLQEALLQGVRYQEWDGSSFCIHPNMNLEPLHDYPPFQELIKPKG